MPCRTFFDTFYRASNSGEHVGTGIGLSLVKLCADNLGGTVDLKSVVGEGTCFTVTLPLMRTSEQDVSEDVQQYQPQTIDAVEVAPELPSDDSPHDDLAPQKHQPVILVVEDNPDIRYFIKTELRGEYNVITANDGADGLQLASQQIPDLIISDLMMPHMDGLQLTQEVRSSELLNHIPIIMVTARSTQQDRITGVGAGVDVYLYKPFNSEELNLRVEKLLEMRQLLRRKYSNAVQQGTEKSVELGEPERKFIEKLHSEIDRCISDGSIDAESLAGAMCMSRSQLNRKILAITGFNTTAYVTRTRINKAKEMLKNMDLSIGDVAFKCGFEDVSYFSRVFRQACSITPSQYRKTL